MNTARRLYVYFIAGVSLMALVAALANLLRLLLEGVAEAFQDEGVLTSGEVLREEVVLYAAIAVVALPIWLVHWWLAERAVLRAGRAGEEERGSGPRALFFAIVLGLLAIFWLRSLRHLVHRLVTELAGSPAEHAVTGSTAVLLLVGAAWGLHAWVRRRDELRGALEGEADWLPRLYRYGAAFTGLMFVIAGSVALMRLVSQSIFLNDGEFLRGERWWADDLAAATANAVAGFVVWGLHAGYALRLVEGSGTRAEHERRSTTRRVYLYLAAFTGVALALWTLIGALDIAFQWLLDVSDSSARPAGERLLERLFWVIPFALLWGYHRLRVLDEARRFAEGPLQAGTRRLYAYGAALLGLAFAGVGLARTLGLTLQVMIDEGSGDLGFSDDAWRDDVSQFGAVALVGSAVWLWHWYTAERWVAADPPEERRSTVRRVFLFASLAASVVALLVSLGIIVYHLLAELLGVQTETDFGSDATGPLGVVLVAAALAAYHSLILRRDMAGAEEADDEPEARPAPAELAAELPLLLSGPPGADLAAVVSTLSEQLPQGYELRPEPPRS
jgi:hypothetical protein